MLSNKEFNDETSKKLLEINEKINETVLDDQKLSILKHRSHLKETLAKRGKTAEMFKQKELILGSKKVPQDLIAIRDPESDKVCTNIKDIKTITLNYCKNLLTNRKPRHDFAVDLRSKEALHEARMLERDPEHETAFEVNTFLKSIVDLQKKKGDKYAEITKGGDSLKAALFKLYKTVWDSEKLPEGWRRTTIMQISKSKGDPADLSNFRNLHLKNPFLKHFGSILMTETKSVLFRGMSKFQLGTKPGHRAQEHIYVLKNLMSLSQSSASGMITCLYDISKFFDRENIFDVLGEAYKVGVRGKAYRLLFEMNKRNRIQVKTPLGMTREAETNPCLGQGTI